MRYINRYDGRTRETVSEYESYRQAQDDLIEYRLSDYSARYYISQRCCKNWKEDQDNAQN